MKSKNIYTIIYAVVGFSSIAFVSILFGTFKAQILNSKSLESLSSLEINLSNNHLNWEKVEPSDSSSSYGIQWQVIEEPGSDGVTTLSPNNEQWEIAPESDVDKTNHNFSLEKNIKKDRPISAHNRSIVFSNGAIGPDIGWLVPNGFRWNDFYRADLTFRGHSQLNGGLFTRPWDGVFQAHYNVFEDKKWSLTPNLSIRSIYAGDLVGGTSSVGEGIASGIKFARSLGSYSGFAIGGEQIIHFDNKTDTGRNLYALYSKAWINNSDFFPVLIANGGIGSGRFSIKRRLHLFKFENFDSSTGNNNLDNDLAFGPIGTFSILFNPRFALFTEFNGDNLILAGSTTLSEFSPIRLTLGVNFLNPADMFGPLEFEKFDEMMYVFRVSLGF